MWIGVAAGLSPARAADIYLPPAPDPGMEEVETRPPIWQGMYVGVSAGYVWGKSQYTVRPNPGASYADQNTGGALSSLSLGYNYLATPNVVVGIEGDLGIMDVHANDHVTSGGQVLKTRFGPFWGTIRARAGFVWDRAMIFATGGLAFARFDNSSHDTGTGRIDSSSGVRTGWVAGGGIEYAFADNITGKLEYLHMDFGRYSGPNSSLGRVSFDNTVNVVRAGISYRF